MEQCSLVATPEEHYVTIKILKELIRHWQHEGYTHLHYGPIRLIISLHGRRGLPISARVSLIDSSFLHYENAIVGTVLTTLHAGSVVLTMFPNYNVSLRDPTVPQRLKVQVQIMGVRQVVEALCATLHHQIIYRLQESCSQPIVTLERSVDRTVRTIFKPLGDEAGTSFSQIFQCMMIRPPIFTDKINGHFIWAVDPSMCDPDCECSKDDDNSEDDESEEEDKDTDTVDHFLVLGEDLILPSDHGLAYINPKNQILCGFRKDVQKSWKKNKKKGSPSLKSSNYEQEFPSLERTVDPTTRINTKPNISPSEIGPDERSKPLTQAEEVLNWQTENAKINGLSSQMKNTDARLELLFERMKDHYVHLTEISRLEEEWKKTTFGETSHATKREIKKLKAQVHDLDHYIESKIKEKQFSFPDSFSPPPFTPYQPLFQPSSSMPQHKKPEKLLPKLYHNPLGTHLKKKTISRIPKTHIHSLMESLEKHSKKMMRKGQTKTSKLRLEVEKGCFGRKFEMSSFELKVWKDQLEPKVTSKLGPNVKID
ncbi:hypothetical protein V8G54_035830 [Vigna mungo]|uniref:Uncharacterized protein n=1 Tax=Vigna mungo TaxID=3915 RepID=A0AAQ3MFL7_VIGMU